MKIAIHIAQIKLGPEERIIIGSLEKGEIMQEVKEWKRRAPGVKVRIESHLEKSC